MGWGIMYSLSMKRVGIKGWGVCNWRAASDNNFSEEKEINMLTQQGIRTAGNIMASMSREVELCREVATALIEVGWPLYEIMLIGRPTDHQRIRTRIRTECAVILSTIQELRDASPNPDLIRAQANITQVQNCCTHCPRHNRHRTNNNEPFECLVQKHNVSPLRYTLNDEGNIIERHS